MAVTAQFGTWHSVALGRAGADLSGVAANADTEVTKFSKQAVSGRFLSYKVQDPQEGLRPVLHGGQYLPFFRYSALTGRVSW